MTTHTSPSHVTKLLRQSGVTVSNTGMTDYRNDGVSYYFHGDTTARLFLKDVEAAGFPAEQWRARVTVRMPRKEDRPEQMTEMFAAMDRIAASRAKVRADEKARVAKAATARQAVIDEAHADALAMIDWGILP